MKNLELGYYFYQLAETQYEEESKNRKSNPHYAMRCFHRAENFIVLAQFFGYSYRVHLETQGWL